MPTRCICVPMAASDIEPKYKVKISSRQIQRSKAELDSKSVPARDTAAHCPGAMTVSQLPLIVLTVMAWRGQGLLRGKFKPWHRQVMTWATSKHGSGSQPSWAVAPSEYPNPQLAQPARLNSKPIAARKRGAIWRFTLTGLKRHIPSKGQQYGSR